MNPRSPLRHLRDDMAHHYVERALDLAAHSDPLAWAGHGSVYVDLPDSPLTPDAADKLADAMHTAAEEARKQL